MPFTDGEILELIRNVLNTDDRDSSIELQEEGENRVASNSKTAFVKFNKDGRSLSLHLKLCEDGTTSGALNGALKIFDREIFFYKDLLPKFLEFQEKHADSFDLESLFFKYHGSKSLEKKGISIILDRFSPKDYFVTAPEEFHTLQQISCCMQKIASFHATSYAMRVKEGINWKHYDPLLGDLLFHPTSRHVSEAYFVNIFQNNLKVLCAIKEETLKRNELVKDCILSFNSMPDKVLKRLKDIAPKIAQILYKTLECPDELCIVTHGDFHMWNVAFSNQGKMDAKFFDFQMLRATSGLIDVHHFLSQVCTPATRNKHLHAFLETYCESFRQDCLKLGVKDVQIAYTMEIINKEYVLRSPWGFVFGFCFILPRFVSKKLLSPDFYTLLNELHESNEIVDLVSKKGSSNVWSVLDMYVDMLQIEEDLGTLELMESLAD